MLIPAIQYGDIDDVRKRMRTTVKRLLRGEELVAVMTEDGLLDVAEHPGYLVLAGRVLSGAPHFHCTLPWTPLWQALLEQSDDGVNDVLFSAALQVPWGVLGLLPYENHPWLIPESRFEPFLEAVLGFWGELDAVGARYYAALEDKPLWDVTSTLHYVLANLGVPQDRLRAPLPPGGPRALLQFAQVTQAR